MYKFQLRHDIKILNDCMLTQRRKIVASMHDHKKEYACRVREGGYYYMQAVMRAQGVHAAY